MNSTTTTTSSWDCLLKDYILQEHLGEGSYGEVRKAVHKQNRYKVAIKRISLPEDSDIALYNSVIREITILRKLSKHASNKFSVRLIDVIVSEEDMKA